MDQGGRVRARRVRPADDWDRVPPGDRFDRSVYSPCRPRPPRDTPLSSRRWGVLESAYPNPGPLPARSRLTVLRFLSAGWRCVESQSAVTVGRQHVLRSPEWLRRPCAICRSAACQPSPRARQTVGARGSFPYRPVCRCGRTRHHRRRSGAYGDVHGEVVPRPVPRGPGAERRRIAAYGT